MCEIIERNRQEAAAEALLRMALSLLKKGRLTEKEAAEEAGMSVSDFRKAAAALA